MSKMESNPSVAVKDREGSLHATHARQETHYSDPQGASDADLSSRRASHFGRHPVPNMSGPSQHANNSYPVRHDNPNWDYGAHSHAQYHYSGQYHRSLPPPPPPMRHYTQPTHHGVNRPSVPYHHYGHPSVYGPPSIPHQVHPSKSFAPPPVESKRPLALHVHNPNLAKAQVDELPPKAAAQLIKPAVTKENEKALPAPESEVIPLKVLDEEPEYANRLHNSSTEELSEVSKDGATTSQVALPESSKKPEIKLNPITLKSPVTLCFERMLGAAKYLAENPTPEVVRLNLSRKRKSFDLSDTRTSPFEAVEDSVSKEAPTATVNEDEANKRSKSDYRGAVATKMESSSLEEDNPFLEIEQDADLLHKVILQMALISEGKETKRTVTESVSSVISEGFYWRDYPILEEILFDNMKNYYNMSSQSRQSRHQQEFNNRLVASIRVAAEESGFHFDPSFNDKRLRDRIRCFYKTHLQNAKKRLATLQKHPNSPIHQSHLRIYIRCVKQNMSVEDSEKLESTNMAPEVVVRNKRKDQEMAVS